jgi:hypothetical protein
MVNWDKVGRVLVGRGMVSTLKLMVAPAKIFVLKMLATVRILVETVQDPVEKVFDVTPEQGTVPSATANSEGKVTLRVLPVLIGLARTILKVKLAIEPAELGVELTETSGKVPAVA